MNYIELKCSFFPPRHKDSLIARLDMLGFESFVEDSPHLLLAYIQENNFKSEELDLLKEELKEEIQIDYKINVIEQQNWNAVWESSFDPVIVNDNCYIRATFHDKNPKYKYEIIIDPRMSFGTGHHETTVTLARYLFDIDLKEKVVLDMGSGTGVLAIIAALLGAKEIDAIDIDQWAYENSIDNFELNNIKNITAILGGAEVLNEQKYYDIVFANINKNILLKDIPFYVKNMKESSEIIFSGFYTEDAIDIENKIKEYGYKKVGLVSNNRWAVLHCKK